MAGLASQTVSKPAAGSPKNSAYSASLRLCVKNLPPYPFPTMKTIDHIGSAFLRQILRRMKQLGVSQTELARRMNVSRPYITKVLSRDVNFSFKTAAKLANALKMDFFPDLRERETSGAADSQQTP